MAFGACAAVSASARVEHRARHPAAHLPPLRWRIRHGYQMSPPHHAPHPGGESMKTHVATSLAHGSSMQAVGSLSADLREKLAGSSPVLLLAFASTKQSLPEVTGGLKREFPGARVLGASTAGEFTEAGDAKGSVSVFALAGDFKVHVGMGTGLKPSAEDAVGHAVALLPRELPGYVHRTAIVLLDPLAGNGEEASLLLAASLGADVAMAGGAAGDDLQMSATHVAGDGQAGTKALVGGLLFSKEKSDIGVAHGHRALS